MHKTAGELQPHDLFLMAGGLYEVLYSTDVDDDELVRIHFALVDTGSKRRMHMTVSRQLFFHTS